MQTLEESPVSVRMGQAPIVPLLPVMLRSVFVVHAAKLLGVSRRTVYYRIREGSLKTVRTRCGSQRVLLESIEALLRKESGLIVRPTAGVSDTGAENTAR